MNCVVFRKAIQEAVKDGRFKLSDKTVTEMGVDVDPFPNIVIGMVSCSGESGSPYRKWKQSIHQQWRVKKTIKRQGDASSSAEANRGNQKSNVFERLGTPSIITFKKSTPQKISGSTQPQRPSVFSRLNQPKCNNSVEGLRRQFEGHTI